MVATIVMQNARSELLFLLCSASPSLKSSVDVVLAIVIACSSRLLVSRYWMAIGWVVRLTMANTPNCASSPCNYDCIFLRAKASYIQCIHAYCTMMYWTRSTLTLLEVGYSVYRRRFYYRKNRSLRCQVEDVRIFQREQELLRFVMLCIRNVGWLYSGTNDYFLCGYYLVVVCLCFNVEA